MYRNSKIKSKSFFTNQTFNLFKTGENIFAVGKVNFKFCKKNNDSKQETKKILDLLVTDRHDYFEESLDEKKNSSYLYKLSKLKLSIAGMLATSILFYNGEEK